MLKELVLLIEANELTPDQKKHLISDFKEWSGGFGPAECPWDGGERITIDNYIKRARPTGLPRYAVVKFLKQLCDDAG